MLNIIRLQVKLLYTKPKMPEYCKIPGDDKEVNYKDKNRKYYIMKEKKI